MGASEKVAATFHGKDTKAKCDHSESLHGRCMTCGRTWEQQAQAREADAEPTPEQALCAHVADLLTDVDHFDGCGSLVEGDGTCTCLIGRLTRLIEPPSAIDTIARQIIGVIVSLDDFGGDWWENIPDVGANDFAAITWRVKAIVEETSPTPDEFETAYLHLAERCKAADAIEFGDGAA